MLKSIKYPTLLLVIFFMTMCRSTHTKKDIAADALYEIIGDSLTENTTAVIVINENTCGPCNQKFCETISKYQHLNKCKYILSTDQNSMDLSMFDLSRSNIYQDQSKTLFLKNIVSSSAVFIFEKGGLDTIIDINTDEYDNKLAFIQQKINR